MTSASSILAPGTTRRGSPNWQRHIGPSTSNSRSKFSNQVDAPNRPGEGECSRNGGSIPLGASNRGPVVQWQDTATIKLTITLKSVGAEMNTDRILDIRLMPGRRRCDPASLNFGEKIMPLKHLRVCNRCATTRFAGCSIACRVPDDRDPQSWRDNMQVGAGVFPWPPKGFSS